MRPTAFTLATGLILALAAPALAAEPGVSLSDGWFRLVLPSRPAAAYFTLTNSGDAPKQLVAAASPGCGAMMLHRSESVNGVEKMLPLESATVPAHGTLSFAPGGYHVMCMMPAGLAHGKSVPVTLSFADGGTLTADFPVKNAAGK